VQGLIRFVGILNASVWLGSTVFFALAAWPAFSSAEMLSFLPRPHSQRAGELMLGICFQTQQLCAAIALLHLVLEYLHSGRYAGKLTLGVILGLLGLGLAGGYWLSPTLHQLQRIRYSTVTTAAQKAAAAGRYDQLHIAASVMLGMAALGLVFYLLRVSRPHDGPRFATIGRARNNDR
jgi:hypothetical protein